MNDPRNIVLMGFMGTGKTSTGRFLAESLGREFLDMDAVIEERTGKKISEIFAQDGEAHFRKLERALVQELSQRQQLVIGCGGGVVLNPDNVHDFTSSGTVIGLHASADMVLSRVAKTNHRPLLEQDDKAQAIRSLLEKRLPLYRALPNPIDTDGKTPEQVGREILALLSAHHTD